MKKMALISFFFFCSVFITWFVATQNENENCRKFCPSLLSSESSFEKGEGAQNKNVERSIEQMLAKIKTQDFELAELRGFLVKLFLVDLALNLTEEQVLELIGPLLNSQKKASEIPASKPIVPEVLNHKAEKTPLEEDRERALLSKYTKYRSKVFFGASWQYEGVPQELKVDEYLKQIEGKYLGLLTMPDGSVYKMDFRFRRGFKSRNSIRITGNVEEIDGPIKLFNSISNPLETSFEVYGIYDVERVGKIISIGFDLDGPQKMKMSWVIAEQENVGEGKHIEGVFQSGAREGWFYLYR